MAGFSLFALTTTQLEKVINKLQDKSYFRLQQTCRGVGEFIRSSRNICVPLQMPIMLEFNMEYLSYSFGCMYDNLYVEDATALYGTRLSMIEDKFDQIEEMMETLKTNRITASYLSVMESDYTKEQCLAVLNTLKPTRIELNSRRSDRYEALLDYRPLKSVSVHLTLKIAMTAAPRLLSTFQEVRLFVNHQDLFPLVCSILELFLTQSLPNLRMFEFYGTQERKPPSGQEFLNRFRRFTFAEVGADEEGVAATLDLSHIQPHPTYCIIEMTGENTTQVQINYDVANE